MRNLEYYGKLVEDELAVIGLVSPKPIRYEASNRLTRAWGNCTTYRNKPYTLIKVATWMLADDIPEHNLRMLLMHECAHAIDENKHGHKGRWLEIAELINDCYAMDIQQYVTNEEREAVQNVQAYQDMIEKRKRRKLDYKWEYHCPKCGNVYRDKRRPNGLAYYPSTNEINYCCGKCKGTRLILDKHGDMSKVERRYEF